MPVNEVYILKHDDRNVIEFNIDEKSKNVSYIKILNSEFSPVNEKSNEIAQAVSFNGWLSNRCASDSREGVKRLKSFYKIDDLRDIMIMQYGLSLSDHYWIDRKPYDKKWKDNNLFENRYSPILGNILFDNKFKITDEIERIYGYHNPDITTGGDLKKYWKYDSESNKSYLIKGSSNPYQQEPFNEYYASLLLNRLDFKHVEYFLLKEKNEYVSSCECITDIEREMISAADIARKYGIPRNYENYVELGRNMGCDNFEDEIQKMIILDYLIDNTDRHWKNFGIIRNTNTGKWEGTIPIFDNGYSLWNKDEVNILLVSESNSFADTNEDCMKYVNIKKHIHTIPDMKEIFEIAFENYENRERREKLKTGIMDKEKEALKYLDSADENTRY